MATSTETIKSLRKNKQAVLNTVKGAHNILLETTEDFLSGSLATGEKFQKITMKAIKKSEPLLDKQVDIVFDAIEGIYGQYEAGAKRFKKLLGITKQVEMVKGMSKEAVKIARKKVEKNISKASKTANKVAKAVSQAEKKSEKVVKAAVKAGKKQTKAVSETLSKIDGIGPKLSQILEKSGIKNIEDLAKAKATDLKKLLAKEGPAFKMKNPQVWIDQAKEKVNK